MVLTTHRCRERYLFCDCRSVFCGCVPEPHFVSVTVARIFKFQEYILVTLSCPCFYLRLGELFYVKEETNFVFVTAGM